MPSRTLLTRAPVITAAIGALVLVAIVAWVAVEVAGSPSRNEDQAQATIPAPTATPEPERTIADGASTASSGEYRHTDRSTQLEPAPTRSSDDESAVSGEPSPTPRFVG